jgi:hypothetical protein
VEWFRVWHDFFDDPKLRACTKGRKFDIVSMLRLASGNNPRGRIDLEDEDIADYLGLTPEEFIDLSGFLLRKNIIERDGDGHIVFINWPRRQPKSDNVAERVAKSRARQASGASETFQSDACNVTVTDRTEQSITEQNRTEDNRRTAPSPSPPGLCSGALRFKSKYPPTHNPTSDEVLNAIWLRIVGGRLDEESRLLRELEGWLPHWDDPTFTPSLESFLTKPKYRQVPPSKNGAHAPPSRPALKPGEIPPLDPEVARQMALAAEFERGKPS